MYVPVDVSHQFCQQAFPLCAYYQSIYLHTWYMAIHMY